MAVSSGRSSMGSGRQPMCQDFCQKLHENERNWTGGGQVVSALLNPQMSNDHNIWFWLRIILLLLRNFISKNCKGCVPLESDDVITLIDYVLDILAELAREEPDDGEYDETSEDARTDIAYRHDHRVSEITTSMLRS